MLCASICVHIVYYMWFRNVTTKYIAAESYIIICVIYIFLLLLFLFESAVWLLRLLILYCIKCCVYDFVLFFELYFNFIEIVGYFNLVNKRADTMLAIQRHWEIFQRQAHTLSLTHTHIECHIMKIRLIIIHCPLSNLKKKFAQKHENFTDPTEEIFENKCNWMLLKTKS